ncbi:MAG: hypothetical protein FWG11_04215, partial [Promicromonosporaceae bacterium]|nr:hypothetical protein [Promicromonosporaceae bacterium]
VFQTDVADPGTVVSAPAADLVLIQPPNIRIAASGILHQYGSFDCNDEPIGHFMAVPRPLRFTGYHPTNGVATAGNWMADLDVSAFPEGTTWRVDGVPTEPVGGMLPLGTNSGQVRIDFDLNQPTWPAMAEGETVDFAARLVVDPNSFSEGDLLNMGVGGQPGDDRPASFNTQNSAVGSVRGRPWFNNDWSSARVSCPFSFDGGAPHWAGKDVRGSWDSDHTIWAPENMLSPQPGGTHSRAVSTDQPAPVTPRNWVSPGTELWSRLWLLTYRMGWMPNLPDAFIVGDTWSPTQKLWDATRTTQVTINGAVITEGFTLQWTDQERTPEQLTDPADPGGWINTPMPNSRSFRAIFEPGVVPVTPDVRGSGAVNVDIPLVIHPDLDVRYDGSMINNTNVHRAFRGGAPITGAYTSPRSVLTSAPRIPAINITNEVLDLDGNALAGAMAGDSVLYRHTATALGMPNIQDPVRPVITVTMDRCALDPVNETPGWNMVISQPAIPGPLGRVCGDPGSTPIQLQFTPIGDYQWIEWTEPSLGNGIIDVIYFTATVARAHVPPLIINGTHLTIGEHVNDSSDDSSFPVVGRAGVSASLMVLTPREEIETQLRWRADISAATLGGTGQSTDTVIILPNQGFDQNLFDPAYAVGYTGPQASNFHGTYEVCDGGIRLDADNTVDRARLYFATNPNPTFGNPDDPANNWAPVVGAAPALLATATQIRVVMPEGGDPSVARVNIDLCPTGNLPDDEYVMWMGRTYLDDTHLYPSWPAYAVVIASELSGLVWWDDNGDGIWQSVEAGIPGVRVTLHRNVGGEPGPVYRETVTGPDGRYHFDLLLSGSYFVQVHRTDASGNVIIPDSVHTFYHQAIDVPATYSARNRFGALAREVSTAITLPRDSHARDVDFGFQQRDPRIALDKHEADVECEAGVCQVTWDVTVTNTGNTPLTGVRLYDRMSDDVFNTSATSMQVRDVVQLASDAEHTLALMSDGTVYGWGHGGQGRLGTGSTANQFVPAPVLVAGGERLTGIVQIDAGPSHGLALHEDGTVFGFGWESAGRIGNTVAGSNALTARRIVRGGGDTSYLNSIVDVAAGDTFSLFVHADGHVYSVGDNSLGRRGNAQPTNAVASPVLHQDGTPLLGIVQVAADAGALALTHDGLVWAWGPGTSGENGDGNSVVRTRPVQVLRPDGGGPLTGITQVAAGMSSRFALEAGSGAVYGWGNNHFGQLGRGIQDVAPSNNNLPARMLGPDGSGYLISIVAISAEPVGPRPQSPVSVVALTSGGELYAVGHPSGTGSPGNAVATLPTPVEAPFAGGPATPLGSPIQAPRLGNVTAITAGAAVSANTVLNWGLGGFGATGQQYAGHVCERPCPVLGIGAHAGAALTQPAVMTAVAHDTTFVLLESGHVLAWGRDDHGGLLGQGIRSGELDGQSYGYAIPVRAPDGIGLLSNIVQISAGIGGHVLALSETGHVYAWGRNDYGQLGLGHTSSRPLPTRVLSVAGDAEAYLSDIVMISAGTIHSMALDASGRVYAWGAGSSGRLGDGATANRSRPIRVQGGAAGAGQQLGAVDPIRSITAGTNGSFAIRASDGQVFAWGHNGGGGCAGAGGLGDGTRDNRSLPVLVRASNNFGEGFLHGVREIVQRGNSSTWAILDNGQLWAWGGANVPTTGTTRGGLVLGVPIFSSIMDPGGSGCNIAVVARFAPQRVRDEAGVYLDNIAHFSASNQGALAVRTDGQAFAWGGFGATQVASISGAGGAEFPRPVPAAFQAVLSQGVVSGGGTGRINQVNDPHAFTVVLANGSVYNWGASGAGLLGWGNAPGTHLDVGQPLAFSNLHFFGRSMSPGVRLTPATSEESGGWLTEAFNLGGVLQPGDVRVIRMAASVLQQMDVPTDTPPVDGRQVIVNQAWVTSPLTPFSGITDPATGTWPGGAPHGQERPPAPLTPLPDELNPVGVPYNPICDTDVDRPQHIWGGWDRNLEDSCDQVPALIPALPPQPLGSLAGLAWVDMAQDGLQYGLPSWVDDGAGNLLCEGGAPNGEPILPGVRVRLYRDEVFLGERVTDGCGRFRFDNLLPGTGYQVQFVMNHLDPCDLSANPECAATVAFAVQHTGSNPAIDSDADVTTGFSQQV